MKIGSMQIGWALTVIVALGFLMPWVRLAPADALDDQSDIVMQLADDDWLADYVLMSAHDWRTLRQNPAAGQSGFQVALAGGADADSAARSLAEILFGDSFIWNKLLALAPLLAAAGVLALMYRKKSRHWLAALTVAQAVFYWYVRRQLHDAYADRLVLELNWGVWLTLYGLLLLALVQAARLALPVKVKW